MLTDPVKVEYCSVTSVTQLPHTFNGTLPYRERLREGGRERRGRVGGKEGEREGERESIIKRTRKSQNYN